MTHEPECRSFDGGHICICDVIRPAYQRGRDYERKMIGLDRLADLAHSDEELEAAYRRGREDAAQEILTEPTVVMFDEEHPNGDYWLRQNDAYVAARGDGAA